MVEYIEREAAINEFAIRSQFYDAEWGNKRFTLDDVETIIRSIPPVDVQPVVRGHKVTHNRPIAGYWASGKLDGGWDGMEGRVWVEPIMDNPVDYCSECGKRLDDTFQNFCPNCGADMMEES